MLLMLGNTPVLYFDFAKSDVKVLRPQLMPYSLRDKLHTDFSTLTDISKIANLMNLNMSEIKSWLSSRTLSLSRENAKQIYNMFNISQSMDIKTRMKICDMCRGISISDSYWLRHEDENVRWEQVNLRRNHFKEIVSVALDGELPSFTTNPICPELTTKGLFRKAWIRDIDTGELYLLKSDNHSQNINTRMEVLASNALDCFFNVRHVQYSGRVRHTTDGKFYVAKCENFVTEGFSFVEAREIMDYCEVHHIDFDSWALSMFGYEYANIAVIDFLILNTDRHDNNYGFMMDNRTGDLVCVAPLFDHNMAFVADLAGKTDLAVETLSPMLNNAETIRGLACRMYPYSNIGVSKFSLYDLENKFWEYPAAYKGLMNRMQELGIV